MKEKELSRALTIFEKLSPKMDARLFRMRRVFWAIEAGMDVGEIESRWQAYQQVLIDWNDELNKTLALLERYFGPDACGFFRKGIQHGFIQLHNIVGDLFFEKAEDQEMSMMEFMEKADILNEEIRRFNLALIQMIQLGKVGMFHPKVSKKMVDFLSSAEH